MTLAWRGVACRRAVWRSGVATLSIMLGWPVATPEAQAQAPNEQELPPVVVTATRAPRLAPKRTTARPAPATAAAVPQTANEKASDAAPANAASEVSLSR